MTSRFSFQSGDLRRRPGRRGGVNTELTSQAFVANAVQLRRDQKRCDSLVGDPLTRTRSGRTRKETKASVQPYWMADLRVERHAVLVGVAGKRGIARARGCAGRALLEEHVAGEDGHPVRDPVAREPRGRERTDVDPGCRRRVCVCTGSQLDHEAMGDVLS